jgi:hypothetical protein
MRRAATAWIAGGLGFVLGATSIAFAQTSASTSATPNKEDGKSRFALETLVIEPQEVGLDAQRTIEGLVINLKNPVKVIANDKEQSALVMSTEFRDKNLKFAAYGMHSWMNVTYEIIEEDRKQVAVYLMEFESPKHARKFFGGSSSSEETPDAATDLELRGSIFYHYLRGQFVLKANWTEPKTDGIERILAAYKAKLLTY